MVSPINPSLLLFFSGNFVLPPSRNTVIFEESPTKTIPIIRAILKTQRVSPCQPKLVRRCGGRMMDYSITMKDIYNSYRVLFKHGSFFVRPSPSLTSLRFSRRHQRILNALHHRYYLIVMLTSRTAARAGLASSGTTTRTLSVLSSGPPQSSSNHNFQFKSSAKISPHYQQQRTLLGLVHAIDKRVYRWAKGVLPPISKTENIALGCGTIGE